MRNNFICINNIQQDATVCRFYLLQDLPPTWPN